MNKAAKTLFQLADTPEKMVALGLDGIKSHVKTIGLYNTKAQNVLALSKILIAEHNSVVPEDRAALESLPGVGRKTANVVLNEAFGWPTIAVDTHIFRVGNRTGMAPGGTPDAVEKELCDVCRKPLRKVPITGLFCMGGIFARRGSLNAGAARFIISACLKRKPLKKNGRKMRA